MNHPTSIILLTLSGALSFPEKFYSYVEIYSQAGDINPASVRVILKRLVRKGQVAKIVRNNNTAFRLTTRGIDDLKIKLSPSKRLQEWDGIWRIYVAYAVDIKSLSLEKLGFRKFKGNTYISPYPISDKSLLISGIIFESRKVIGIDDKKLAARLWKLDLVHQHFIDWIAKAKMSHGGNLPALFSEYTDLISKIPKVPQELLPKAWPARRAYSLLIKLVRRGP